MRLKSVKLSHFRGYRTTTVIPVDDALTGIIGGYDDGQSTILAALTMVFARGNVMADKSGGNGFRLVGVAQA